MASIESTLKELAEALQAFAAECHKIVPALKPAEATTPEKQENTNV